MQALIEAYKNLEISDKAQLPYPKPAMAPKIKAFAQALIDFNLDNLSLHAITPVTEKPQVAVESANAQELKHPQVQSSLQTHPRVDEIKEIQSALFKFATWYNGPYSTQISNYIKPLTLNNVREKVAAIDKKIASPLADAAKVAESDSKLIIDKMRDELIHAAGQLTAYYDMAPKNDENKNDEEYIENRKTYLLEMDNIYQAFVKQEQLIDVELRRRISDEETITNIKQDNKISEYVKNVTTEMQKEKIRVYVEIFKRRLRWIKNAIKEMENNGRNPARNLTDENTEEYKKQLQQLIDKLRREQTIVDGLKADIENHINRVVGELSSGSILDRQIKESLKKSFSDELDKISKIKKEKLELAEQTLKNVKKPLRQRIQELLKQPGKKIVVIKITDANARSIAGVPTGDHLKALYHDGNDSFTWVSFGATGELKEPVPGAVGAVARLLHVPANQYQGGFNDIKDELDDIEAQEGGTVELEVLDCQAEDGDYIGLDYDKAKAWVHEQMAKPASELKYNLLEKNCAFYVMGSIIAGGAEKFLKLDHTTFITGTPVPAYAFDCVKKLYHEINIEKNEQLKKKLDAHSDQFAEPTKALSIKDQRRIQLGLNAFLFNALLEYLSLPDVSRVADAKIGMIQAAVSMAHSAVDELAKNNQALDEANSESIVKATYVQYQILATTIDQLTQEFPVNARPEKVSMVIDCLQRLLSYFPPAEEYFLYSLRKDLEVKMKDSRDKFYGALKTEAMQNKGVARAPVFGISKNIESYQEDWDSQIRFAMEKNDGKEESPFRIAMRVRNVIKWVENKQVENILVLKNLESKLANDKAELSALKKLPEDANKADRLQQKQNEISQCEEAVFQVNELIKYQETTLIDLAQVSGKLNCYIYCDNPKMASESAGVKIHPRNLLGVERYDNAPIDFMGSLNFKTKKLFNHEAVAKPGFWGSVFGTIFPWKQDKYNEDMRKMTKNSIHDILFANENKMVSKKTTVEVLPKDKTQASVSADANPNMGPSVSLSLNASTSGHINANVSSNISANAKVNVETEESPYKKFERIKQKIAENKPYSWNIFRRSERKHYEKMENQAQLACLLEAFGKGYINEERLGKQLVDLANKEGVENAAEIKQFVLDLQKTFVANQQTLGIQDFMQFKASGIHAELSTSAKLLQLFHPATGGIPTDNPKKVEVATKVVSHSKQQPVPVADPKINEQLAEFENDLTVLREPHW